MIFYDSNNFPVLLSDIVSIIDDHSLYEVYVGTDSQFHTSLVGTCFVTCIVIYKKGKGGRYFTCTEYAKNINSLREKLTNETMRSLLVAFKLQEVLPLNTEIILHIDVNENKKYESSSYSQELVGMVVGQGFKCKIKPHAWAAQSVANKHSK